MAPVSHGQHDIYIRSLWTVFGGDHSMLRTPQKTHSFEGVLAQSPSRHNIAPSKSVMFAHISFSNWLFSCCLTVPLVRWHCNPNPMLWHIQCLQFNSCLDDNSVVDVSYTVNRNFSRFDTEIWQTYCTLSYSNTWTNKNKFFCAFSHRGHCSVIHFKQSINKLTRKQKWHTVIKALSQTWSDISSWTNLVLRSKTCHSPPPSPYSWPEIPLCSHMLCRLNLTW